MAPRTGPSHSISKKLKHAGQSVFLKLEVGRHSFQVARSLRGGGTYTLDMMLDVCEKALAQEKVAVGLRDDEKVEETREPVVLRTEKWRGPNIFN